MDLRMGVLQHIILQHKLKAKKVGGGDMNEGNDFEDKLNLNLDELSDV